MINKATPSISDRSRALRVAIVHDWLVGGGAEKVVLELHKLFPDAPIYTSYCTQEWREKLDGKVVTGYLQHWPFSMLRKYLPVLRIRWFQSLRLDGFDVIISSKGNGEANNIRVPKNTVHICYCHSPTHFYWRHYKQYLKQPGFGLLNPLARVGLKLLVGPLRKKDYKAAQNVDYFIANSTHIQSDIKKFYKKDSVVIHPPVDIERLLPKSNKARHGFVTVGRLVPYKRTDIIVEACSQLHLPLTVVGRGPELKRLRKLAGPTVTFDTNANDEAVANYLQTAEAFLFAAQEDFGITPVEAMAAGTPVIAYRAGGALDYINDKTGMFFDEQTPESLKKVLQRFKNLSFNHRTISQAAQKFSTENFRSNMLDVIQQSVKE